METKAWHKDQAEKLVQRYGPGGYVSADLLKDHERLLLALVHAVLANAEGSVSL
jgi:hypothetical protein